MHFATGCAYIKNNNAYDNENLLSDKVQKNITYTQTVLQKNQISVMQRDEKIRELQEIQKNQILEEEKQASQKVIIEQVITEYKKDLFDVLRESFDWGAKYGLEKRVQYELSLMANQDFITEMFYSARYYLYYIVNEAKKRNMPLEIALLPGVESMFQPYAYSYADAAGMWQIIPDTGEKLGLTINWWHDERRDIPASTNAALNYLEKLYEKNNNDWLLALASYNAGIGRIIQAQKINKKKGKPVDYWSLQLPRQTKRYVPRLIALSMIVDDPKKFGIQLQKIENNPAFVQIQTSKQLDLQKFAKRIGLSENDFHLLNPGYNQRYTDPARNYTILVPNKLQEKTTIYLASNKDQGEFWITHKVEKKQPIDEIATMFNISEKRLRKVNKITNNTLHAGSFLLVPVNIEEFEKYSAYHTSDPDKKRKRNNDRVFHKLVRGDSLWGLSKRYNVSIKDLMRWNNINAQTRLYAGKKIVVSKVSYRPIEPLQLHPEYEHQVVRKVLYPVRRGDSLYSIAQKFNISIDQILRWNADIRGKILKKGKNLQLYIDITKTY